MIGWQAYLDGKFPQGGLVELALANDPETDPVALFRRIVVILDEPVPVVVYSVGDFAPHPLAPHRLNDWKVVQQKPFVATCKREDGMKVTFSNRLSEANLAALATRPDLQ